MRLWTNIVSAVMLTAVAASGAEPGEAFAGWPKSWMDAYGRFEKFVAVQSTNVPVSDLEILPHGEIQTSLPDTINRERHTTIVFYSKGSNILEMGVAGGLFNERHARYFNPGTYATCLRTCDELIGYQFRHPLMWFQVDRGTGVEDSNAPNEGSISVRMIEQPQPAQDFWPNERLLRFYDFQVFPHINPLQFFRENNKVTPSVTLAVTNAGIVQREQLDDALEKLLRWRVYYNGRLVEKGSAAGDIHHAISQGVGTYVIFVGVEGPDGFMPVSNFLQFPLFPERDGKLAVLPSVTNEDGLPDCLVDALTRDQMSSLRGTSGWTAKRGAYNRASIYGLDSIGPIADVEKQALISLWSSWAWSVDLAKANPASVIGRIHMSTDAK